jgi:hypothetical protein
MGREKRADMAYRERNLMGGILPPIKAFAGSGLAGIGAFTAQVSAL